MSIYLLVDFGSTYTKIIAVDLEKETILGRAQAYTTIDTDITIGLNNAKTNLINSCELDETRIEGIYASSSAAGGLKMAAIGLVPELTLEAARRAALGAGAKVVCSYGFEIDEEIVKEIEDENCDIILLSGGTDGGDKNVIIHNAKQLANSDISCPVLVAGNRVAANDVRNILESAGKTVYLASNVLPSINTINAEPAQQFIREIFIAHIIKAKGLEKAQDYIGKAIIPTPKATLQAAELLADGHDEESGIGSLVIVEIGGATTNIHSVIESLPAAPQTIIQGLPELRVKRTVEGDLGIRWNAKTIYDFVGGDKFLRSWQTLDSEKDKTENELEEHVRNLSDNVGYTPSTESEFNIDIALAECATTIAVQRHAGTIRQEFSVMGDKVMVQNGKNLLETKNIIGTGGIFKYGLHPERILRSALYNPETPWSLKPKDPNAYVDRDYILYGIGLLAVDFPAKALRIAKKYLKPTTIKTEVES